MYHEKYIFLSKYTNKEHCVGGNLPIKWVFENFRFSFFAGLPNAA